MKKAVVIIIALASCISYGCEQTKFRTVQGKKAPYSISIPVDYTDEVQYKGQNPVVDLEYGNGKEESVVVGVVDLPPDDTTNYFKQFSGLLDSEFIEKINRTRKLNLKIIDRKIIEINGVKSYFVYYRSDELYYQMLFQFNNRKMLNVSCGYHYKRDDSLRAHFYQVVNSVV